MSLPEKVKIGWKEYAVVLVEAKFELIDSDSECYGEIDYDKQIIRINEKYNENQKKATLIHEILHGLSDMYSLDLSEDVVTKLANCLYTLELDNGTNEVENKEEKRYISD